MGQGNITDFTQCIYRTGSGDDINFGWNWDWPIGNSDVKAYPGSDFWQETVEQQFHKCGIAD